MTGGPEYFHEEQQFSPALQSFALAGTALAGAGLYGATRETPGAEAGLLVILGAMVFIVILFATLKLTTIVGDDGVRIKGMWFVNRLIAFSDIESAQMRQYRPLLEYGGWGYRVGPAGKAYNAQGDEGVQLTLKGGGRVLIGSQRAMELASVINAQRERT